MEPHHPGRDVGDELRVLEEGVGGPPGGAEADLVKEQEEQSGRKSAGDEGGPEAQATAGQRAAPQEEPAEEQRRAEGRGVLGQHGGGGEEPGEGGRAQREAAAG